MIGQSGSVLQAPGRPYPREPYVLPQLRRLSESPFTLSRMQHRRTRPGPRSRAFEGAPVFAVPLAVQRWQQKKEHITSGQQFATPVGVNCVFVQTDTHPVSLFLCVFNLAQPTGSTLTGHFIRSTSQVCAHVPRSLVTPFLFA